MIQLERSADGSLRALGDVVVGVTARRVEVPLGFSIHAVDPGGLRGTPVVVVTNDAAADPVRAGARRAGRATVADLADGAGPLGGRLLAAAVGAEVVLASADPSDVAGLAVTVRALDGRPLPVLPLDDPDRSASMLDGCWVDLDIALPAVDGPARVEVRRAARRLGLFAIHHVVEVDPRPGLEGAADEWPLELVSAAATGVLAGRVAAGNRAWR